MKNGFGEIRESRGAVLLRENMQVSKETAVLLTLLFLTARANIGGILPFGLPACAAFLFSEECAHWPLNRVLYLTVLVLGSASLGRPLETAIVSVSAVLFCVFAVLLAEKETVFSKAFRTGGTGLPSVRAGMILLFSTFVPSVLFLAASNASLGDFLRMLLQLAVMFPTFYIYCHARNALAAGRNAVPLTQEQFSCLCIAAVVVLMGLPELIIAGLSTLHLITICLLMLCSCEGGFAVGAACGTVGGVLMASGNTVYMVMYAMGGFLAGLLNRYRRAGTVAGFVLSNILLACVVGGTTELITGMYETGFAAILFFLLPRKPLRIFEIPVMRRLIAAASVHPETGKKEEEAPLLRENYVPTGLMIRETAKRMAELARISEEIGTCAAQLFEEKKTENADHGGVLQIYGKICMKCTVRTSCWGDAYVRTYRCLLDVLKNAETGESEKLSQAGAALLPFCPNTERVLTEAGKVGSFLRAERVWRSKNAECRKSAAGQLSSVGKMIRRTEAELNEQRRVFYELRAAVLSGLNAADLTLCDFAAQFTRSGRFEIRLAFPAQPLLPCGTFPENTQNGRTPCRCCVRAAEVLSRVTGKSFEADGLIAREQHICTVLFRERCRFTAEIGVASAKAYQSPKSGDCFTRFSAENGTVYAVLSDGLGTGERAAAQSKSCLRLIRLFLEGGLTFAEAAEAVDQLVAAAQDGETVSSGVDALCLDLYGGTAHFAKRGAAPSYYLWGDPPAWREITIADAPLGFHGTGSSPVPVPLERDSTIVLISDGVGDAFTASGGDENSALLPEFLTGLLQREKKREKNGKTARALSQQILKRAVTLSGEKPKDDMTVAVICVAEK